GLLQGRQLRRINGLTAGVLVLNRLDCKGQIGYGSRSGRRYVSHIFAAATGTHHSSRTNGQRDDCGCNRCSSKPEAVLLEEDAEAATLNPADFECSQLAAGTCVGEEAVQAPLLDVRRR